ncbi:M56 family metallopeptidase [Dyella japonica]|uniref:M56 family metallopeptidase n=1 Tax=Dyella japonica TaxID=231455 RepID=UPI0002E31DD6|nr:M56 family metallopeptidase [Dyella japonica]
MSSPEWISHGWLATLAFTFGVCAVALLRHPCRRLFGTELAALLWTVPPLAVVVACLPHVVTGPLAGLPPIVVQIASAPGPLVTAAQASTTQPELPWFVSMAWLGGVVGVSLVALMAQRRYRYRLRDAVPMPGTTFPWPVLKATHADVGPALVGAWRPRIVLPADFERRYEPGERALILAHEATHARRLDGWWCLIGQAVASLFWFHPLAWWGLRALRHDLELACDAAVVHTNDASRAMYARAMLKTQATGALLPVGCSWSSRHPVTERIVMLKRIQPGHARRSAGRMSLGLLVAALSAVVYAATGQDGAAYHPGKDVVTSALKAARPAQEALAESTSRPSGNPSGNAALGLPAPDSGAFGPAIKRLEIAEGGHVLVTLADVHGAVAGHLDLEMHPAAQVGSVGWSCRSSDIPDVQQLAPTCSYLAGFAGKHKVDLMSFDRFSLDVALSINGKEVDKAAKVCLKTGEPYRFTREQDASHPPVQGSVSVQPMASGQVEIRSALEGGIIRQPIFPKLHSYPGQTATIQVGEKVGGDHPEDHTVKLDVIATPGCA